MRFIKFLPFMLFILLVVVMGLGLFGNPRFLPSPFIGKKVPEFNLQELNSNNTLNNNIFLGKPHLLNVFATWCETCIIEHGLLNQIARETDLAIIGLNYKDDKTKVRLWLKEHGNPYQLIGFDESGKTAIDWGVYGTPETFLIDKTGIVRYKHIGALTRDEWQQKIYPLYLMIKNEK